MRDILNKVLIVVTIVATVIGTVSTIVSSRRGEEVKRLKSNLYQRTVEYKDENGRLVREVTELRVTNKELKEIAKKDTSTLNEYEKKLARVYAELDAAHKKVRNLESATMATVEVRRDVTIPVVEEAMADTSVKVRTATYEDKWGKYRVTYNPAVDSVRVEASEIAEIMVLLGRGVKLKDNGGKHFPNWGFMWGWDYKATVLSTRDSSVIRDAVHVKFQKGKGKR